MLGGCAGRDVDESAPAAPSLRVLTLNLHHGRGTGAKEKGSTETLVRGRLGAIADLLRRESVDVAGFQEADGPSTKSGNFDHVTALAEGSGLTHVQHGLHCNRRGVGTAVARHGTAVVSRRPLTNLGGGSFTDTPMDHKGFVVATVTLAGREIDVISVHLHFLISPIRQSQVRALIQALSVRRRPLIVLGDLNCDWAGPEKTLRHLAAGLGLTAFEPENEEILTFPSGRPTRRLDWSFVSSDLEIRAHRVLPDLVSGHRAGIAEVGWRH